MSDPRLLDIAERFIGPDIALFASHYISKPAGDGQPVLWHQDGSYWPLEPMEVVSLWLAVDDLTPENGCMRVIPKTHHLELQAVEERTDVANVLRSGVHHPNIIHGSNANTSPLRRCGLTIRYIPASTRIISDEQWPSAFLLRGKAVPGVNMYLESPKFRHGEHMAFRGSEQWF